MKKIMLTMAILLCAVAVNAKTLIASYSYTNNMESIVTALKSQNQSQPATISNTMKLRAIIIFNYGRTVPVNSSGLKVIDFDVIGAARK